MGTTCAHVYAGRDKPYFAVYNAHFFAQIFEGKIRMHIIHGYNEYIYHGYNNGCNNPVYNAHKNMSVHYTRELIIHSKIWVIKV